MFGLTRLNRRMLVKTGAENTVSRSFAEETRGAICSRASTTSIPRTTTATNATIPLKPGGGEEGTPGGSAAWMT